MHAQVMRGLITDPAWSSTEIAMSLLKAEHKAKHCRCNKLACLVCGITMLNQRIERINRNPKVKTWVLTGGREIYV